MAHKVAILDDYQHIALSSADWSSILPQVSIDVYDSTIQTSDEDALAKRLYPYEIICLMRERTKITKSLLDRLPNLKFISSTAVRNLAIDLEACKERGVVVSHTGVTGNATLEHIWALILAVTKNIAPEDANMKAGKNQWQSSVSAGLDGRTLGLIGLGKLGIKVTKIAHAFGMRVLAWSPHLTPERAAAAGAEYISTKEELLCVSDIVSVHVVLGPTTEGLITASDFALMKSGALFINTARGPIVDEVALIDALKEKKIKGAALDVYDIEPLPLNHPLRKLDNVTLSPHLGYSTEEAMKVFWRDSVENIAAYLSGRPVRILASN